MLQVLERGNDGRQWHTLIDKVFSPKTLKEALKTVTARNGSPGVDGQTAQAVRTRWEEYTALMERLLREGRYEPKPVRRVWIDKPGSREKRPLGIPTIRDRIVQTALLYVLEPVFEYSFHEHSYGFRPGRSARQAVDRVEGLLSEGCTWVVDADIKGYFDNIPQDQLLARVKEKIADSRILALLEKFLKQGVMEGLNGWTPTESGTPQGAVISPLLANIYLNPLDHSMDAQGYKMVRYADDFVILCRTEAEAREALAKVQAWMKSAGLTLHPDKTRIVDATVKGGFEFLGWHFERGYRWPREKSQAKLKESIRGQTRRSEGRSLSTIIQAVNRRLRGWGNYFRGGGTRNSPAIDGWVRKRLRSILRKREKRKGCGHGRDHNRYPNVYFAAAGLITLQSITHPQPGTPRKRKATG
jgi:RNA-directed DNA polymerase